MNLWLRLIATILSAFWRPRLVPPDEVSLIRSFWLMMHADSRDLARIRAVAEHIYAVVEAERALFAPGG